MSEMRNRRRADRVSVKVVAKIFVQMIGSSSRYEYETDNISLSGLLLRSAKKEVQFNMQSILEVWLYPSDDIKIFFFAKYVRKADDHSFALKITDIDDKNRLAYDKFFYAEVGRAKKEAEAGESS